MVYVFRDVVYVCVSENYLPCLHEESFPPWQPRDVPWLCLENGGMCATGLQLSPFVVCVMHDCVLWCGTVNSGDANQLSCLGSSVVGFCMSVCTRLVVPSGDRSKLGLVWRISPSRSLSSPPLFPPPSLFPSFPSLPPPFPPSFALPSLAPPLPWTSPFPLEVGPLNP